MGLWAEAPGPRWSSGAVHGFIKPGPSAWRSTTEIKRTKGYRGDLIYTGGSGSDDRIFLRGLDLTWSDHLNHGRLRFNGSEGVSPASNLGR
jgi:hypothetical protein